MTSRGCSLYWSSGDEFGYTRQTLERVWLRVQSLNATGPAKLVLRPKQERLLHLLRDNPSMAPAEIWKALGVTRQGAIVGNVG
jgi:hypothetical protein